MSVKREYWSLTDAIRKHWTNSRLKSRWVNRSRAYNTENQTGNVIRAEIKCYHEIKPNGHKLEKS